MAKRIPKATHTGELEIANLTIPCAVLENGTRVLSERGMTNALGGTRGGSHWKRKAQGGRLPAFVSATNLSPFMSHDLREKLASPIVYQGKQGGRSSFGISADVLPEICDIWLKARDAGELHHSQHHIAAKADTLMRGLAHVGVIALVDEATGYQEVRNRDELQKILAAYISPELLPWAKRFPDEFYEEMFRLRGWRYNPVSVAKPGYVGKLTNELVYQKLPPGVLDELRKKNPRNPATKRRAKKHHQFLTQEVGNPHLEKHLAVVTVLMRAAPNWVSFKRMFARAFPENTQLELDLGDEDQ